MQSGGATVVFTVQPIGWVGDWHENALPRWIVVLSGHWSIESMDGTHVEQGPGEFSFGEDLGCTELTNRCQYTFGALCSSTARCAYRTWRLHPRARVATSAGGPSHGKAPNGCRSDPGTFATSSSASQSHPLEPLDLRGTADTDKTSITLDHSTLSVVDLDRSIAFHEELGSIVRSRSLDTGIEQTRLDGVSDARVDVIASGVPGNKPHQIDKAGEALRKPRGIAAWPRRSRCDGQGNVKPRVTPQARCARKMETGVRLP